MPPRRSQGRATVSGTHRTVERVDGEGGSHPRSVPLYITSWRRRNKLYVCSEAPPCVRDLFSVLLCIVLVIYTRNIV